MRLARAVPARSSLILASLSSMSEGTGVDQRGIKEKRLMDRLLRQSHLELDRGQLLGRPADALQERQPARVVQDVG
jgi:hypothetical protein